jgi:hypothetical protein
MINKSIYYDSVALENLCRNKDSIHRNLDATCTTAGLSEGVHTLIGVAVDEAGNRTEVESNSFIVDTTNPTITVKDSSTGSNGFYSNVSFKLFDANKVDRLTLNDVEKDFTDNKYSDLNNVNPGKFGAVEGENTLVVYDVAGNSTMLTFTIDTVAPAAPQLVSPSNGATQSGGPTQTWSHVDPSDVDYYVYESYRDAGLSSFIFSTTTSNTSRNIGGQQNLDVYWRVAAVDAAGNQSEWSNVWLLTVDNTAPVVTINTLTPVIVGDDAVFTGTMDDADAVLTFTLDGTPYPTTKDGTTTWRATVSTTGFDARNYNAVISAEDAAGNTSASDPSNQTTLTVEEPVALTPEEEIEGTDTTPETAPLTTGGTPQIAASAVLGDTTTGTDEAAAGQNEEDAEVEGATTEGTFAQADTDTTDGTFLGLAWYWWLLIVGGLAALIGWLIAAARRREES